ncbi:hypothetical protein [Brachybacterium hainanense]|uniref:Uncharacterized protein n=1 Tax=Brachybacterium hainanense TaxID=1541174 RepID=A0ABV6R6P7_9MICO
MTSPTRSARRALPLLAGAAGCVMLLVLVIAGGIGYLVLRPGPGSPAPPSTTASSPSSSAAAAFEVIRPDEENTRSPEELRTVLAANPLTQGRLPATGPCTLPEVAVDSTPEQLQTFLQAGVDCYARSWAPAMSDRNLPWATPRVVVFVWPELPPGHGCDSSEFTQTRPTMCDLDETLYWPVGAGSFARAVIGGELPASDLAGAYLWDIGVQMTRTMAWQSSLVLYMTHLQTAHEDSDPELRDTYRRTNLQLLCVSAASSVQLPEELRPSTTLRARLLDESSWTRGEEPRTLPPSASIRWLRTGLESRGDLSHCNTWTAAGYEISG